MSLTHHKTERSNACENEQAEFATDTSDELALLHLHDQVRLLELRAREMDEISKRLSCEADSESHLEAAHAHDTAGHIREIAEKVRAEIRSAPRDRHSGKRKLSREYMNAIFYVASTGFIAAEHEKSSIASSEATHAEHKHFAVTKSNKEKSAARPIVVTSMPIVSIVATAVDHTPADVWIHEIRHSTYAFASRQWNTVRASYGNLNIGHAPLKQAATLVEKASSRITEWVHEGVLVVSDAAEDVKTVATEAAQQASTLFHRTEKAVSDFYSVHVEAPAKQILHKAETYGQRAQQQVSNWASETAGEVKAIAQKIVHQAKSSAHKVGALIENTITAPVTQWASNLSHSVQEKFHSLTAKHAPKEKETVSWFKKWLPSNWFEEKGKTSAAPKAANDNHHKANERMREAEQKASKLEIPFKFPSQPVADIFTAITPKIQKLNDLFFHLNPFH